MKRGRALRRRTPLKQGDEPGLKRTSLRPISEKKKAQNAAEQAELREHGGAFRAAIRGERCVVCQRTEKQAYDATGWGHQAHHAIPRERLRKLGLIHLLYDPGNAVCACEEPCHRQHTSAKRRIQRAEMPARVMRFIIVNGLTREYEGEYPS